MKNEESMKNSLLVMMVLLLQVANAQVVKDSLEVEGFYRSFQFNKPMATQPNGSLVFVLHGSGGSGKQMMDATSGLLKTTANENVIFVYADGYKHYWNECRKAASSLANKLDINEQAFFSSMIDYFVNHYNISREKVFAVGTSGGGHMCYKLAMTMPKKIRAITAIIANLPDDDNMDCVDQKVAIPVMIVNGTADPLNKYEGGMMKAGDFVMGTVKSTDGTFHYWSDLAGYKGDPVKTSLPDKDPNDGKNVERYTYKQKDKPEVTLLKVIGGKHDYPNDIDVHVEAWEFFKRQF
jgi:polyhydroxybutyrate depolymerase